MSETADRILELIDQGLDEIHYDPANDRREYERAEQYGPDESGPECGYSDDVKGSCVRGCHNPAEDGSDFCGPCRAYMLEDTDEDPTSTAAKFRDVGAAFAVAGSTIDELITAVETFEHQWVQINERPASHFTVHRDGSTTQHAFVGQRWDAYTFTPPASTGVVELSQTPEQLQQNLVEVVFSWDDMHQLTYVPFDRMLQIAPELAERFRCDVEQLSGRQIRQWEVSCDAAYGPACPTRARMEAMVTCTQSVLDQMEAVRSDTVTGRMESYAAQLADLARDEIEGRVARRMLPDPPN